MWQLPRADTYFAPHLTAEGFQVDHLKAALKHCRSFRTAIDGGAHIGTWAVHMATRFGRVIAFEPAADTFRCLVWHVRDKPNVLARMQALGERPGRAAVLDDVTRKGNTGARFLTNGADVEVVRIDDLGIEDLDFLKLDVEGYELFALRGAERTLKVCRPVVCIEEKRFAGRFGAADGAASEFLRSLGAREIEAVRNDHIFVWDQ